MTTEQSHQPVGTVHVPGVSRSYDGPERRVLDPALPASVASTFADGYPPQHFVRTGDRLLPVKDALEARHVAMRHNLVYGHNLISDVRTSDRRAS